MEIEGKIMNSEEIKQINEKLDLLTAQMMSITSRLQPLDELKEDVALFSTDIFNEVINFLADVDFHFDSRDMTYLGKKLLVNVKNISKALDTLSSAIELMDDVKPLAKDIFNEVIQKLHMMEKHNFFANVENMMQFPIKWNENFEPNEISNFSDAIIRLAKIGTKLGKPENLDKLAKIADALDSTEFNTTKKVSLFTIIRKARSKEVLNTLNYMLDLIKNISK